MMLIHFDNYRFLFFGADLCKPKKADHQPCGKDKECQSGACGGCLLNEWCYVKSSKAVGDSCFVDAECGSEECTASCNTPFPKAGVCACQQDEDCGEDQYCDSTLVVGGDDLSNLTTALDSTPVITAGLVPAVCF